MTLKIIRFCSLLFTAIAMSAGLAHLFALPNKIHLPREDYLTVQQIYRGWALPGIALIGALISTLILTVMVRRRPKAFVPTLAALLCTAGALVVFFAFTYPANQRTENWTVLPADWQQLRNQWEYSHAANATLYVIGLSTLIWSVLAEVQPILPRHQATSAAHKDLEAIHQWH